MNCKYSDKSAAIVSFAFVFSSHLIRTGVGRRSRLIAIVISAADSSPSRRPPFLGSLPSAVKASIVRLRWSYCERRPTSLGGVCTSFLI
ncbi:hypothetical protein T03_9980 [Trichinella britovi]|uniref:Uncharacterized protein n=2 Tax=Trichinella TaxID=6333 RepID=A0A0V0T9G6_9BILA|nr:hypothetical protein T05_3919 [Trichinella murrelli]KRX37627.1 hypothetical protein T05_13159 [Trichinella murrelli]KRY45034.1 hypothetical protein T03_9980 [Trichinella britovi]